MTLLIFADSRDAHANLVEHAFHVHGVQTTRLEHQNPEVPVPKPFCDFLIDRRDWAGALALSDMAAAAPVRNSS